MFPSTRLPIVIAIAIAIGPASQRLTFSVSFFFIARSRFGPSKKISRRIDSLGFFFFSSSPAQEEHFSSARVRLEMFLEMIR